MKKHLGIAFAAVLFVIAGANISVAVPIPTYTLALLNNNTQVQITILNANPNSSVTLFYPVNSIYMSIGLGNTNNNGQLTTTITPATYNMTAGSPSYVTVSGAQSNPQNWPQYSQPSTSQTSIQGSLTLIPSSLVVTVGDTKPVVISANSSSIVANISSNTNPSVAGVNANGTQMSVIGLSVGSTQITVCAGDSGCAVLPVTVQAAVQQQTTTVATGPVAVNPGEVSLYVGETRQINVTGGGTYFIGTQSNPGSISTNIVGNVLTLTALLVGEDSVGVCSQAAGSVNCTTLLVHMLRTATSTSNLPTQNTIAFDRSDLSLSVGQNQSVKVSGSGLGTYYISSNTNPGAFTANIDGNTVTIFATQIGAGNITVCQFAGQCGQIYAHVPVNDVNVAAADAQNAKHPMLSSFNIQSNNANSKFAAAGSILTVSFSTTETVTKKSLKVAGSELSLLGSGTGAFTGNYTITGYEKNPIPITLSYSNNDGYGGDATFYVGAQGSAAVTDSSVSAIKAFTKLLRNGSVGAEVTALQTKLKAAGVYSGPITGTFGAQTEAAVKKFQTKYGLKAVGEVGPATRDLLNK